MPIDYENESKQLHSGTGYGGPSLPWFNPSIGSHRIKILTEGQEYKTVYRNQEIQKVRFEIEVNGEKFNWGVSKGRTPSSLWGQLVVLGKAWGGLIGKQVSLIVKASTRRDGSSIKEYTVLESVNLQQAQSAAQPAAPVAPVATSMTNIREKLNASKGKMFVNEADALGSLGITADQLRTFVFAGLIEQRGNGYVVA